MTTIGDICNREVIITTSDTTVTDAAKSMREHHVGSLVVVAPNDRARLPIGIVTDRDLVIEIIATELDPHMITVGEIMGPALATVPADHGIRETLELMSHKCVRRLPVMSKGGQLLGIVTSDDLLTLLAQDLAAISTIATREQSRESAQRAPLSA